MPDQKRILIVDSSQDFQDACAGMLKGQGYEVYTAGDGEKGFDIIQKTLPDLLVLDALTPVMDATQILKKIKDAGLGKDMRCIVLSDRGKMRDYFDTIGVDGFLEKPVDMEALVAKVKQVLAQVKSYERGAYKRVLVIGRSEECVMSIVSQLKAEGAHTDFVLFGSQVISKAVLFLPGVIIIESRMIDMSSHALIKIIRQMPQFKRTPILIYNYFDHFELQNTNIQQQEMALSFFVQACLDEGATESIGTYYPEALLERVGKYLKAGSIVVVDDDEGFALLMKRTLEAEGYQVFAARDAKSGLEKIKRVLPHLIILDIRMPGTDGYALLETVKKDRDIRDIPVVICTVQGEDKDIQRCLDAGADDYVIKPFYMKLFIKRLKTILNSSR